MSVQCGGQDRQEPEGLTQSIIRAAEVLGPECSDGAGRGLVPWILGGGGLWGGAVIELSLTG